MSMHFFIRIEKQNYTVSSLVLFEMEDIYENDMNFYVGYMNFYLKNCHAIL